MTSTRENQIVTGADFVTVPTNDLETAVAFYGETRGLQRSAYHPKRNFAEFETRAELEGRGVEFTGDIFDSGVCHMAFFADPDGNALMLHHRYAPRTSEA